MTTGPRKSGFPALGALTWGSHLCHFYESRSELLSVTADFLHAGLANREAAVWIAPALLGPDKARYMLTRTAPALAEYIDAGQLQILDGAQIYASPKTGFNGGATVGLWSKAINDALGRGFEGLRVAGDAVCNESTDWVALLDYEASLKERLAALPIIGLCTYCVQKLRTAQARDIERLHDAKIERPRVETPGHARAQAGGQSVQRSEHVVTVAGRSDESEQASIGATIGHEIRNAITPLGLLARLLNTQYGHDEQLTRYALLLSRQASVLGQLAQQLMAPDGDGFAGSAGSIDPALGALACASRERAVVNRAPVDVGDLLAHCVLVAEAGAPDHAPIQVTAGDAPLRVQGDFGELTQVFVNLLINALKYSAAADAIKVTASRAGRYCYISVSDEGAGIAPGELASIFKPYARGLAGRALGTRGHGLGLAVVRDIVASHGGTVEAFSGGLGRGSEFVVRLPLAKLVTPITTIASEAQECEAVCAAPVTQGIAV
ncbi:MEDS domain-containing protein [Paraburkholderia sp. BL25I1N1]|uniref:MEDS domain-containing protein n=1 Tax=Paraburkholderia sp. BL25I1N1 TaxID=1938804 RepID=UPI000D067982|nr:MEDS domain-containing protein [Paraburkholderia sp. BL25I1N1]PRY04217.1 signal transduction histidine kinase [Paraburkholderia sp. BL25I1N1]